MLSKFNIEAVTFNKFKQQNQNRSSPKNDVSPNGVLRPKLLSIPFASCSFINPDVLLSHASHFDGNLDD